MSERTLETNLLRAFLAVAETGSFTAAADIVGRSQSAVSQMVLRLEKTIECRVFIRTSRTLKLTRDGDRLVAVARQMLAANDAFMRELRKLPARRTIRLGISENLVATQLPDLLSRFCNLYPNVHLELMTGLSAELLEAHDNDRLDVAIVQGKSAGMTQHGRVIWREPLVWVAALGYEADRAQPVRLTMLPPPCSYREIMMEALDSIGREYVAVCTAGSLTGLQSAIIGGMGVSILGKSFVKEGMRILHPTEQWPKLPMTEVMVVGEQSATEDFVKPLVSFLTQQLTTEL